MVDPTIPYSAILSDFDMHIRKCWSEELIKREVCDYDRNILVFLNEYLYAKEHDEVFFFADNVNVEHIMPASGHNIETIREDANITTREEFSMIVNKLGNKILLEEDINKSIGKEWFKTKKQKSVKDKLGYKDSRYHIAKALAVCPKDAWTKDDIEIVTQKIASRIFRFIWNAEEVSLV